MSLVRGGIWAGGLWGNAVWVQDVWYEDPNPLVMSTIPPPVDQIGIGNSPAQENPPDKVNIYDVFDL